MMVVVVRLWRDNLAVMAEEIDASVFEWRGVRVYKLGGFERSFFRFCEFRRIFMVCD